MFSNFPEHALYCLTLHLHKGKFRSCNKFPQGKRIPVKPELAAGKSVFTPNCPAFFATPMTAPLVALERFQQLVASLTESLQGRALDEALASALNAEHPAGSPVYEALFAACRQGVAEGWMCESEHGGIRYGRVLPASEATHGFSVDVVEMADVAGPHHGHPQGEIDLVMPLQAAPGLEPGGSAQFDGQPAGWKVYGPALVLYLLPGGAIEFTRSKKA